MTPQVLIIEDHKDIATLLEIRLRDKGYEVLVALDGAAGLDMAKQKVPDLIILDIELPGINGFTVCSVLKGNPTYRGIPIIMLTARRGEADRVFDERHRPELFITKPFDSADLLEKVAALLEGRPRD